MASGTKKRIGGAVLVALAAVLLCANIGCEELFGFDTEFGWSDWGWGDNYDSNWYTDSSYNGDDEGFYIMGDDFTYISGW